MSRTLTPLDQIIDAVREEHDVARNLSRLLMLKDVRNALALNDGSQVVALLHGVGARSCGRCVAWGGLEQGILVIYEVSHEAAAEQGLIESGHCRQSAGVWISQEEIWTSDQTLTLEGLVGGIVHCKQLVEGLIGHLTSHDALLDNLDRYLVE